jgi:predicted permease
MSAFTSLVFSVVQIFNRRSIGYLWDKKAELDPGQVSIINSIYNNK